MKTIVNFEALWSICSMETFFLEKIEACSDLPQKEGEDLVKRLYELGLRPGLSYQVVTKISFNSVTVIQYGLTRLALNEQEMACLHGR